MMPLGCDAGVQFEILLSGIANENKARIGESIEDIENTILFPRSGRRRQAVKERSDSVRSKFNRACKSVEKKYKIRKDYSLPVGRFDTFMNSFITGRSS
jgi:hypothetical protein